MDVTILIADSLGVSISMLAVIALVVLGNVAPLGMILALWRPAEFQWNVTRPVNHPRRTR